MSDSARVDSRLRRRMGQEDHKFQTGLGSLVRLFLKKKKSKRKCGKKCSGRFLAQHLKGICLIANTQKNEKVKKKNNMNCYLNKSLTNANQICTNYTHHHFISNFTLFLFFDNLIHVYNEFQLYSFPILLLHIPQYPAKILLFKNPLCSFRIFLFLIV